MKKLLIFLVVVVALFSVGDYLARDFAEGKAADELQERLDLSSRPNVGLGGWPFVVAAFQGEFPSIEIDADRVVMERLEFLNVNLDLEDLTFSVREALRGGVSEVTAQGGTGTATLEESSVNQALRRAGAPFTVHLMETEAVATLPNGSEVNVALDVSGGALRLAPESHLPAVGIQLPGIVDNLTYRSAVVTDGEVAIRLRLGPTQLQREV